MCFFVWLEAILLKSQKPHAKPHAETENNRFQSNSGGAFMTQRVSG